MGGQLTVSSIEHYGSTFTFLIPYRVSLISDSSDDPDELSYIENQDDGNDDDLHSGVFLFEPRNLGSLCSSQSTGRIQKLSSNSYGFNASKKLNVFLEDECSAVGAMETSSELEVSPSQGLGSDNLNAAEKYDQDRPLMSGDCSTRASHNQNEIAQTSVTQERYLAQVETDTSSECSSSNSPGILKSELKPKILLVEDNKINVMVTTSMMNQLGHNIYVVNNGAEAVQAVQCRSYDLVLMVRIQIEGSK